MDLSSCNLASIPGEFTYMTRLMELNLASNRLSELPSSFGRLSRLVRLNLSDNQLTDLPLSLGYCIGLGKIGAGISLERNPIKDSAMLQKYAIGTDHLADYLEKRMDKMGGPPVLEEFTLPFGNQQKPPKSTPSTPKPASNSTSTPLSTSSSNLDEKLVALKKWANTTIQSEMRFHFFFFKTLFAFFTNLHFFFFRVEAQRLKDVANNSSLQDLIPLAQKLRDLKTEMAVAREKLPPFTTPAIVNHPDKAQQLKNIVISLLDEFLTILRSIQTIMNETSDSQKIVAMIQMVKALKEKLFFV